MTVQTFDIGNHVECDGCGKDFTNSDESGGFIFCSNGYGPCCAEKNEVSARRFSEEHLIKARCPITQSFRDFILQRRAGNNTISIVSGNDAMREIFGVLGDNPS